VSAAELHKPELQFFLDRVHVHGVSFPNMPQTPVTVVAEAIAKTEKESEARQLVLGLLEPTRKEEGCIQYDPHELTDKPGHFIFYENWASQAALDARLKSPHIAAAFAKIPELFEGAPRILICKRIG
jgi:quinol monooxygenase YgiN